MILYSIVMKIIKINGDITVVYVTKKISEVHLVELGDSVATVGLIHLIWE